MAKKTPVKKSKRGLKRSVRRSLAAVFMVTAIGVAAIPVPENYAQNDDIMLLADSGSTDVHTDEIEGKVKNVPKFEFNPNLKNADGTYTNDETLATNETFKLDYYAETSDTDLANISNGTKEPEKGKPKVYPSLAVTKTGTDENPDYTLNWQFMYYEQTNPDGGSKGGVICRYNQSFYSPDVTLNLYPITKYFVMTKDDITEYFTSANWADGKTPKLSVEMDGTKPTTKIEYTYERYSAGVEADYILEHYFTKDLEDQKRIWDQYVDTENSPSVTTISRAPIEITDGDLQLEYFKEHCKELNDAFDSSADYDLCPAHDIRPGHSGEAWLVKVINGPKSSSFYKKGDYDFLASEPTKYPIIAIGDKAFSNVKNVETMTVPDQLRHIGNEAFMGATMLRSITLVNVPIVGNRAFKGCTALETVNLASTTEVIGQECFSGATHLQSIAFGGNVTKIGYGAFQGCISLLTVSFSDGGQACEVGDYAFYDCTALTSVSMENSSVSKLGTGAFAVEAGGEPISFVLPQLMSGSESIGNYLFAGRSSLQSVVFPVRYGYSSTVNIPNSIFHNCVSLQYVEFPCSNDRWAGGFVNYTSALFADVLTTNFYVRGPRLNSSGETAYPRTSTWNARTAVSNTVPYVYVDDNGVEYYEVSDGYYLLCINNEGVLTSCTFNPGANVNEWVNNGAKLVIPAVVGDTRVTGIAGNCFSDSELNANVVALVIEDNSEIASIADGAFQAGGGTGGNDWKKLKEVYIGNSITSIGDNAFKDCSSLIDVTFSSPLGGHEAFTIGTDAFKTESKQLTFHGDIVEGYAPFEWATDPGNIIQTQDAIRVCYKSLSPTYLTVMYNPITEMVTLLDYPKYNEISQILAEAHAAEIREGGYSGKTPYEDMKVAEWYGRYGVGVTQYDTDRYEFIYAWLNIDSSAADTDAQKNALYASDLYGPWIDNIVTSTNPQVSNGWTYWVEKTKKWAEAQGLASNDQKSNALIDWLFEPITAYALEDAPLPYYEVYEYNVAQIVDANDPYRAPTAEEQGLVYYTKNIEIPAGVQSIDVYGYVNNLTADGEKSTGQEVNTGNYRIYLRESWDSLSRDMYETEYSADEDGIRSVPGLFSGYYRDGAAAIQETRERGNDVIRSVTMYTVEYLPDYAFDSCESLSYVILGEACADIGKAPFRGCHSMTAVGDNEYYTTVNGIIYSVNTDGSYTIEECLAARGNLVGQAVINVSADADLANVSAIKPGAFEDCDYLTEVNFGSRDTAGLTVIPEDCFRNCDRLQTVVLPITTNDVERGAFVGVNNLTGLTVYGKEVKISARAFDGMKDTWTTVRAYEDSAVVRYVKEYGDEFKLRYDDQHPLGELWLVSFYDYNYTLIEDLKDQLGNDLENPQYVEDGALAILPQNPASTDDWTFERWVGANNVNLGEAIREDTSFYAQGYTNSGLVNGKYPVEFYDGVDGQQVGPTQYIDPGSDAIAPGHPVHAGYDADGFSGSYTNIQAPTTIIMKYKTNGSGGSSGQGNGSNGSTTNNPSGAGSTTSTTSGSGSATGKYTVTVVNGSGSGTYDVGSTVIIAANTAPTGMVFQKWTTESNGVTFASVSMSATTFVMPANNVTVTANYAAGKNSTSNSASGSNNKNNGTTNNDGSTRVDITKPGISNKDLATAHVNGSTDNFVIKITETDEATRAVADALTNRYGSLENILYYAMDVSLYDATGTVKISDTSGITVDITIPIPDALVAYGGNNMAGAVINGNQLENLNESFTTINGVPCIRFTATHFSPYTIYVDTGNLTEGMLDTTPKTGDPIHPKWFLSIGLACLSVILFMKKDKAVKVKTA